MSSQNIVILPTSYFPPASYFVRILNSEKCLLEQMETYPKQTYRNRCEIMTSAGRMNLVVPVSKPNGNHTLTRDIMICYRESWQQHHWKSIYSAYRSSPYFRYYSDLLSPIFEKKEQTLIGLNFNTLQTISTLLKVKIPVEFTVEYEKEPGAKMDFRKEFSPKRKGDEMSLLPYPQVFSHRFGFAENLSIIDLLFNLGPDTKAYLSVCV